MRKTWPSFPLSGDQVTLHARETSRLTLVLHRVRTASDDLCHILDTLSEKMQRASFDRFFPEITDEDIDRVFSEPAGVERRT
jgi:hypothetical protein